ncbi:hypothetical protein IJG92_00605 [Candidatus Saccharibacteria bacterium]|nr:hypothetical protein [Candidatus Saccharibacteria bacterium]
MGTTHRKTKLKNKWGYFIIAITFVIILALIILINQDYGLISDRKKANEFNPSPEIEALVSKMNLTDRAKTMLYASSPQLKDKVAFNGTCGHDGDPDAYVAGCYYKINDEEYIDIYNSGKDATELQNSYYNYTNSKIVTLAHEMMHAVYSRLPDSDKEWIEIELNKIYANNSNLRSELSSYPSSQKFDELYVRVATEVYGISSSLEKHYALYFKDRQYIAKLYHGVEDQLNTMFHGADEILEKIKKQEVVIQNSYGYYARRDAINEYNRLVDLYNSQIGVYRDILDKRDSEK